MFINKCLERRIDKVLWNLKKGDVLQVGGGGGEDGGGGMHQGEVAEHSKVIIIHSLGFPRPNLPALFFPEFLIGGQQSPTSHFLLESDLVVCTLAQEFVPLCRTWYPQGHRALLSRTL